MSASKTNTRTIADLKQQHNEDLHRVYDAFAKEAEAQHERYVKKAASLKQKNLASKREIERLLAELTEAEASRDQWREEAEKASEDVVALREQLSEQEAQAQEAARASDEMLRKEREEAQSALAKEREEAQLALEKERVAASEELAGKVSEFEGKVEQAVKEAEQQRARAEAAEVAEADAEARAAEAKAALAAVRQELEESEAQRVSLQTEMEEARGLHSSRCDALLATLEERERDLEAARAELSRLQRRGASSTPGSGRRPRNRVPTPSDDSEEKLAHKEAKIKSRLASYQAQKNALFAQRQGGIRLRVNQGEATSPHMGENGMVLLHSQPPNDVVKLGGGSGTESYDTSNASSPSDGGVEKDEAGRFISDSDFSDDSVGGHRKPQSILKAPGSPSRKRRVSFDDSMG